MRGLAAAALALQGVACGVPDRPSRLPPPLPDSAVSYLGSEAQRRLTLADGVWYRYVESPRGPWAVHLVEARLDRCDLGLDVVRARADGDGHAPVSEMVASAGPGVALAAVNGDFFTPEGRPLGPELVDGVLRTPRSRPAVAWRPGEVPWIGSARASSGEVTAAGWRAREGGVQAVLLGGYPELLDRGREVGDLLIQENPGFAASRHPRTAVGVAPDRSTLWLVVVDGRQPEHSLGMTLPELAGLFGALGAPEALNLDGGGSSVMVLRGRVVSRPSDAGGERAVVNALVLRRDPGLCPLAGGPPP